LADFESIIPETLVRTEFDVYAFIVLAMM